MTSVRLLLSESFNPWFNLSLEEYIFNNMPLEQSILFLWRNQNTVVIGRAQNAWKECNTRRMERDKIKLARRNSGGGAVFHDLGNTCFTFMSTQKSYNKHVSMNIILNSLNNLGVKAIISGRNDLLINTKYGLRKISGSAYREKFERKLHHGTLLLHTDLNKLTYYLNPDLKKLETKGITSIKSRVINLKVYKPDINHENICQQLIKCFFQHYNKKVQPEVLSSNSYNHLSEFVQQFNKQRDWNWNFGSTPNFIHQLDTRFHWGGITLHFDIERGVISRSLIFTDSLTIDPLENLAKILIGIPYNTQSIQKCCEKWMNRWIQYPELLEVTKWLTKSIE